jgi:hypothetical protein
MSVERIRFAGGALHGKVVWMEPTRLTLDVHVGGQDSGASRTLHYKKSGALLCYVGESQTPATELGATQPPDTVGRASSTQGVA